MLNRPDQLTAAGLAILLPDDLAFLDILETLPPPPQAA